MRHSQDGRTDDRVDPLVSRARRVDGPPRAIFGHALLILAAIGAVTAWVAPSPRGSPRVARRDQLILRRSSVRWGIRDRHLLRSLSP
jgi:hypothetical protein